MSEAVVGGFVVAGAVVAGFAVVGIVCVGVVDVSTDPLGVEVVVAAVEVGADVGALEGCVSPEPDVRLSVVTVEVATIEVDDAGSDVDVVARPSVGFEGLSPTIVPSWLLSTGVAPPTKPRPSEGSMFSAPIGTTRFAPVPIVTNVIENPASPTKLTAIRARCAGWTLFSTIFAANR